MSRRDWQRDNFDYLRERFNPDDEMALNLLSDPTIVPLERFPELRPVVNPWVNLYELLAMACDHGWIAQDDLWGLSKPTILGQYLNRSLVRRFNELYLYSKPPRRDTADSKFGVFTEVHWSFRRDIDHALFGLHHQPQVVKTLLPNDHEPEASLALQWLDSGDETNPSAVAFKALFALHMNVERITSRFALDEFADEVEYLYQPWRDSLDQRIRRIVTVLSSRIAKDEPRVA
jgi:hypothetical protein